MVENNNIDIGDRKEELSARAIEYYIKDNINSLIPRSSILNHLQFGSRIDLRSKDGAVVVMLMNLFIWLIARNGKKYAGNLCTPITIKIKDFIIAYKKNESSEFLNTKMKMAIKSVKYELNKTLDNRMGLLGHKGYFNFQKVEGR